MLKRNGRWRTWLGKKGEIWYYRDEQKPPIDKSFVISILSLSVALASVLVSSLISYLTLTINERTFFIQHNPHITFEPNAVGKEGNKYRLLFTAQNTGDTTAVDVSLEGYVGTLIDGSTEVTGNDSIEAETRKSISAGSRSTFTVFYTAKWLNPSKPEKFTFSGTASYKNLKGEEQPESDVCAIFNEKGIVDCDEEKLLPK